jgi:nucleoside-diphosphate-sugar epimerase
MRVLVIGGTSFIGPHVVTELHHQGHEVTVYHRGLHESTLPSDVRHIHSPRASIPVLHFPSSLSDPRPDVVLHMFPVGEDDARAAVARFAGVARRMVGISSGDVYRAYGRLLGTEPGPLEPVPLEEEAPLREVYFPYRHTASGPSDWAYHYDKILAERSLRSGAIPATVLRLSAVYGPGDGQHRLRPYIKRMLDRRSAILLDTAHAAWRWSHGYVENIAHAIVLAVTDERAAGKVYNVGEEETPILADRVRRIGVEMGWAGKLVQLSGDRLPPHLRPPYQPRQDLVMDAHQIRNQLGYREVVSEQEGLRRTIEWEADHSPIPGDPTAADYAAEDAAIGTTYRGIT